MNFDTNVGECAHGLDPNAKTCIDEELSEALESALDNLKEEVARLPKKDKYISNLDNSDDVNPSIEIIKNITGCKNESCALEHPKIKNVLGYDFVQRKVEELFKPEGPYDSNQWFSNSNIDEVLSQIAESEKYKHKNFKHIPYHMNDFQNHNTELKNTDFAAEYIKGIRCFGVVFNTDKTSGRGQHWFAGFGDFNTKGTKDDPFTIEYFNSSGNSPSAEIKKWMCDTKNNLCHKIKKEVEVITVTDIVNQRDNHSCGSYSIYYIISRLNGIHYTHFANNKIGDDTMHDFREYYLFRKNKH